MTKGLHFVALVSSMLAFCIHAQNVGARQRTPLYRYSSDLSVPNDVPGNRKDHNSGLTSARGVINSRQLPGSFRTFGSKVSSSLTRRPGFQSTENAGTPRRTTGLRQLAPTATSLRQHQRLNNFDQTGRDNHERQLRIQQYQRQQRLQQQQQFKEINPTSSPRDPRLFRQNPRLMATQKRVQQNQPIRQQLIQHQQNHLQNIYQDQGHRNQQRSHFHRSIPKSGNQQSGMHSQSQQYQRQEFEVNQGQAHRFQSSPSYNRYSHDLETSGSRQSSQGYLKNYDQRNMLQSSHNNPQNPQLNPVSQEFPETIIRAIPRLPSHASADSSSQAIYNVNRHDSFIQSANLGLDSSSNWLQSQQTTNQTKLRSSSVPDAVIPPTELSGHQENGQTFVTRANLVNHSVDLKTVTLNPVIASQSVQNLGTIAVQQSAIALKKSSSSGAKDATAGSRVNLNPGGQTGFVEQSGGGALETKGVSGSLQKENTTAQSTVTANQLSQMFEALQLVMNSFNNVGGATQPMAGGATSIIGGANPLMGGVNTLMGGVNPLMGGNNHQMGGVNPLIGGVNPLMGGVNPLMGGANPLMGRMPGMTGIDQMGSAYGMMGPHMFNPMGFPAMPFMFDMESPDSTDPPPEVPALQPLVPPLSPVQPPVQPPVPQQQPVQPPVPQQQPVQPPVPQQQPVQPPVPQQQPIQPPVPQQQPVQPPLPQQQPGQPSAPHQQPVQPAKPETIAIQPPVPQKQQLQVQAPQTVPAPQTAPVKPQVPQTVPAPQAALVQPPLVAQTAPLPPHIAPAQSQTLQTLQTLQPLQTLQTLQTLPSQEPVAAPALAQPPLKASGSHAPDRPEVTPLAVLQPPPVVGTAVEGGITKAGTVQAASKVPSNAAKGATNQHGGGSPGSAISAAAVSSLSSPGLKREIAALADQVIKALRLVYGSGLSSLKDKLQTLPLVNSAQNFPAVHVNIATKHGQMSTSTLSSRTTAALTTITTAPSSSTTAVVEEAEIEAEEYTTTTTTKRTPQQADTAWGTFQLEGINGTLEGLLDNSYKETTTTSSPTSTTPESTTTDEEMAEEAADKAKAQETGRSLSEADKALIREYLSNKNNQFLNYDYTG